MMLSHKYKYTGLIILFTLFVKIDFLAQKILPPGNDKVKSISSDLLIYEDKDNIMGISEILSCKTNALFSGHKKEIPSFSFTTAAIWCKFEFENKTDSKYFLEINPPILNEIVLYAVLKDGRIDSTIAGSHNLQSKQGLATNGYIFELDPDAKDFYIKVKSSSRLYIEVNIGSFDAFLTENSSCDIIVAAYGGILLMIFLYNLFLFISSYDKIYFYYLLHLSNSIFLFLYLTGVGNQYVWTQYTWVSENIISIMSIGFVFPILLTVKYLDTKTHSTKLHFGMILIMCILGVIALIDVLGNHYLSVKLLNIIGFIIVLFVLFSTAVIKKRGYKPAIPFFYAWIFYFVGILVQVLQGLNVIPTHFLSSNALQIGNIVEVIIISLAIGYKINYLKNEMKLSVEGKKKALLEKENLISKQSVELEGLARQQSTQIRNQNIDLKQKNIEILQQNEKIKLVNIELQQSNKLLESKNKIINKQNESLVVKEKHLQEKIKHRTFELEKATKKAEEADRLKTLFLKNVSHEIRTPMNAISGFASLLFDIDKEDKRHTYYVDIISKNTDDLLNLIDNIIELSRIQTGKVSVKKISFDVKKVFTELNELFLEKMKVDRKSFISLKLAIPDNNIRIKTDYNKFWKIVFQLLDNAIKYTEKGSVTIGYNVLRASDLGVFVEDTGIGIRKEKLNLVFDRFNKTEDSKTKIYSGTGLGLSLVKGFTEHLDGTLTVNSKSKAEFPDEPSGTSFILVFKNVIAP
ncbi:MAG: hypothetical protein B6I20_00770 [Bacteroidetes bacterium 4572_117]|nr:MAG: hypothetical protein B6I20_00770 [Bacteroidetes bacterium 4572_117]